MYEPKMDGQEYVTITLTRAEHDALVRATEKHRGPIPREVNGPNLSLEQMDLRFAAEKIAAAKPERRPEITAEAAGAARRSAA